MNGFSKSILDKETTNNAKGCILRFLKKFNTN
jgi:hypothetical protein